MKKDERKEPEWTCEGGIWVKRWPQPEVSARDRLIGLHHIIPAGQIAITKEYIEEMNELAKLIEAEREMASIRAGRSKGGLKQKRLRGLQAVVDRLVTEHPEATAQELWNLIPESEPDDAPIGGFILYRDGSKIVQAVEDEAGRREKSISFRSFCRYVTRARSK